MKNRVMALYERHGEKLRFLVIGVWNTLFSIGVLWLLDRFIPYDQDSVIQKGLILVVQWVICVSQNFLTFKFLVFQSKGGWISEYLRMYVTYLATFVIQSVLTLTISGAFNLSVFWANLPTTFIVMIVSYIGHKYFTFRDAGSVVYEEAS